MARFVCVFLTFLTFSGVAFGDEKKVLNVYAPDYFSSEWGPGPIIEESFQKICNCDLKFTTGDLLPRIRLEGKSISADIVIGLDTGISQVAREADIFSKHDQDLGVLTLPIPWHDEVFLPFNWSYFSFIYNNEKLSRVPKSFDELLNGHDDIKIIIQDPRTSVSGLGLVLWVKSIYKDNASMAWRKLSKRILTVTKGWSEAYGLFLQGEADMVLSFTTSPAYHIIADSDHSKTAVIFNEGHYLFVESVAKTKKAKDNELADLFMSFILSESFQKEIPTSNWSYPAALAYDKLPDDFKKLPLPQKTILMSGKEVSKIRKIAIDEWEKALRDK
ncbi:MAG: thiamine ABC transporter substrate binding subunit [Pseudomonadota bacterium]|nr:thiamine ABC transporter substrate binding subunit [Pseudomonadota bacterium]